MFEICNSSGVALADTDLIKNYIFFYSYNYPKEEEELEEFYDRNIERLVDPKEKDFFYNY